MNINDIPPLENERAAARYCALKGLVLYRMVGEFAPVDEYAKRFVYVVGDPARDNHYGVGSFENIPNAIEAVMNGLYWSKARYLEFTDDRPMEEILP